MTAKVTNHADEVNDFNDLDQYIDESYPLYSALLGELCAQPSVASRQHNRNSLDETARLIAAALEERDFKGKTWPTKSHPALFASLDTDPDKPTLLSFNSYELLAAEEMDEWQRTMFGLSERDGMLYGRGIADNKANFVARLAALDAWRAVRGDLPVNFKFVVEGRDPSAASVVAQVLDNHLNELQADGCLWESGEMALDGNIVISLGVKGLLRVELESKSLNHAAPSALAGILPSGAWRLIWALSVIKNENEDIQIEDFERSVSVPTAEDSRFLMKTMAQHGDRLRQRLEQYGQTEYLMDLQNLPLLITEFFTPTANVSWLTAGSKQSIAKPELLAGAKAHIDFRLVPDQDPDEIFTLLREHLIKKDFNDIEVRQIGTGEKPARTPPGHHFVKMVTEGSEKTRAHPPLVVPLIAAAGPLPEFKTALPDLPVVICGCNYSGSARYSASEHIRRSDFITHIKFMTRLLAQYQSAQG